ncbi:MAG: sporulation protein YqfD, partial [Clostridia bacterium]|nr:sporulation protein YqfD [Clostridia bacterium]
SILLPYFIGLIIGAITMALTTINLTSTIYSVSINTTNHVCQNGDKCIFSDNNISKLYTSLSDLGIKKGAKLNKIPPNKAIKNKLILNSPQISEVYIEQKGVYITVNILEAKLPTNDIKTDLVATHSGIVVKTDIISGEPKVKIGDIVLKGDTLIKNTGTPANGTVVLRAFYHENAIFDEKQITYERTGKTENINNISLFGLELNSDKKSKFTLFEAEEKHKFLSVNTLLPIKLHQTTFYELRKKEETISFGLKEAEVKQTLQEKTKLLLPKNAEIKNTNFTVKQEGSRFLVTCYIETYLTLSI